MGEAAPRLLHLVRLSWLLAAANLALGRPAAAARLISVAEHAYGARRSAWRRASFLLAACPPGGGCSAVAPSAVSAGGVEGYGGRVARGVGGQRGRAGLSGYGSCWGGGSSRDPALSMCRFLRGLAFLARGDRDAAVELLQVFWGKSYPW